jgi:hypothetical protein
MTSASFLISVAISGHDFTSFMNRQQTKEKRMLFVTIICKNTKRQQLKEKGYHG